MNSRNVPFDPVQSGVVPGSGLPTHLKHLEHLSAPLDVIAVISNPRRYRSRYDLYRAFERRVMDAGCRLTTVELAYGERPFEITCAENPRHLQLRTGHELWHKENLINLGIQRLPRDWKYVAWIDSDIQFTRPDWAQETIHQLQHYHFVQMFEQVQDLGPEYEPLDHWYGFVYSWINQKRGFNPDQDPGLYYQYMHTGFAWAARREAIDAVGGLIDYSIAGAADHHMAWSLIGNCMFSCHGKMPPAYKQMLQLWEDRCTRLIHRNIGYVPGMINHYWHGKKKNRYYKERWRILVENNFDPVRDLKRDWQGLWQISDENIKLRDDLRAYFRSRNEDSIDCE